MMVLRGYCKGTMNVLQGYCKGSVRPEGWEKLTLNRCNFSHFLSIITPVKVEFLTLYVNNYTN